MKLQGIVKKMKKIARTVLESGEKQNNMHLSEKAVSGIRFDIKEEENKNHRYIEVTGISEKMEKLCLPEKINSIPVEVISACAFKGNSSLKSVILPNSVRKIEEEAFRECEKLKSVELPADLKVISSSCFEGCTSLEKVILPYSVKEIEKAAFKNCSRLNQLYHFMKTGIGAVAKLNKKLIENHLPIGLAKLGEGAFEGCSMLKEVYIPYSMTEIPAKSYKGCESLESVLFHNQIKTLGEESFLGCPKLKSIKLPPGLEDLSDNVFDEEIEITVFEGANSKILEKLESYSTKVVTVDNLDLDSCMIPGKYTPFYNEEDLMRACQMYELRNPVDFRVDQKVYSGAIKNARYSYADGQYTYQDLNRRDKAKIIMVGDLMCRGSQQKKAWSGNAYDFDYSFHGVRKILSDSDLTIGNMEAMIAKSFPYSEEIGYLDDRVHLNAPEAFLSGVRNAGFDLVINAQNHAYDTGLEGIYETLDAMNKYQLMHTGLFASESEKRYLSLNVNGINIAVLAYCDQARQKNKRANFTDEGLRIIYNCFDENVIRQDIQNARVDGAEFIIVYCHFGKEYTKEIRPRQEKFARMVANAGADYIFGSHPHCLQPYSVIQTDDERLVPVLYSGGNFMSDMDIKMPITRDTLILQLELERSFDGKVSIKSEGYYPCLIENGEQNIIVRPIADMLGNCSVEEMVKLEEDVLRIGDTIGGLSRLQMLIPSNHNPFYELELNKMGVEHEVCKPLLAKQPQISVVDKEGNDYVYDELNGIYKRDRDESMREARLICTGQILYDREMEKDAECFGRYEFARSLKAVSKCFNNIDLAVAPLASMCSVSYPTMRNFVKAGVVDTYCNARIEFVSALKDAGISCVAMANPYNACTGVEGIFETEQLLHENKMICSGIGSNKNPIILINGIRVAILSYTIGCYGKANTISDEGSELYLNEYRTEKFALEITKLKKLGAEFVLVYADCSTELEKYNLEKRKEIAIEMAELGADYVICLKPNIVSKYYRHTTADGRCVPLATSIGTFLSGKSDANNSITSAVLKIIIRKTFDDKIEVNDNFIPAKVFKEYHGANNVVAPASSYFNASYKLSDFPKVKSSLKEKLGNMIAENNERQVFMKTHYKNNFTVEELYKFFGVVPTEQDIKKLGEQFTQPVKCIVSRKPDLMKGCVALLGGFSGGYQKDKVQLTVKDAVKAGAVLLIDTVYHKELPCIVIDKKSEEAMTELAREIRNRYNPLTVAITGSVGKTTTKDLMRNSFSTHYRTMSIEGNNNTIYTIRQVLQKLDANDEAYIQEVHGGTINSAKNVSKLIHPNICVITSIGQAHLAQMGSMENVIAGKMELIEGMQEDGVLVINDDNEYLHAQTPEVRTIRYSSYNSSCDYYAQNIVVSGDEIHFQIVSKGGEFDQFGVYDAKLNIQGEHNVNNAVGVFAASRQAGIPPHKIIAGLASYRTQGVRQNIINAGGVRLLVDVYSSNPISLLSAMHTLDALEIDEGGRRIAVVGELPDQGEESQDVHYQTGKDLCKCNFDILFTVGPDAEYIAKAAKENGRTAYHFRHRDTLNAILGKVICPGDIVLFKASTRYAAMKDVTLEPLFGQIFD